MQSYIDIAEKNGIVLLDNGVCQFCGADTIRGVHECVEIFSLGFQKIDYSKSENHLYRFLAVDAHTLQHPEIHGRWSNHFHLTRQHLVFNYQIYWDYKLSPMLSEYLDKYKADKNDEYLDPPEALQRGIITTTDIMNNSSTEKECIDMIIKWGTVVYKSWGHHHETVDKIAEEFLNENKYLRRINRETGIKIK